MCSSQAQTSSSERIRVVGGVILKNDSVFMAQRPVGKVRSLPPDLTFVCRSQILKIDALQKHAGLWEFPGGKVEAGESDENALQRELLEELSVPVKVGKFVAMGSDGKV
jgi:8-oxo-dGTP pyrophosphatase MutT (NUDIX family)